MKAQISLMMTQYICVNNQKRKEVDNTDPGGREDRKR